MTDAIAPCPGCRSCMVAGVRHPKPDDEERRFRETVRRAREGDYAECSYHPGERHGICSEAAR